MKIREIYPKKSTKQFEKYSKDAKREEKTCRKFVCIACGNKHLKCLT